MRILVVAHGYPPNHRAGTELRAERRVKGLQQRGHDVAVLAVESASSRETKFQWSDGIQDGTFVRRLYYHLGSAPDPFGWSYDNPEITRALDELVSSWHPGIVHVFSGYLVGKSVTRVTKTHRLPLVISLTDYWWLCHRINFVRSNGQRCEEASPVACARCKAEVQRRYRLPAQVAGFVTDRVWDALSNNPTLARTAGIAEQEGRSAELLEALGHAGPTDRTVAVSPIPTFGRAWIAVVSRSLARASICRRVRYESLRRSCASDTWAI